MKYPISFLLFFMCMQIADAQPLKVTDKTHMVSKEDFLKDIDVYGSTIAREHVHPFTNISRKHFFSALDSLKEKAGQYDIDQLFVEFTKVNALLGDEHTRVLYVTPESFPFKCFWFDSGIYIVAVTRSDTSCIYAKIIAVNGMPINDVANRISLLLPDKNTSNIKTGVQDNLFNPFMIHGLGISNSRDSIVYTIVNTHNDTLKITPHSIKHSVTWYYEGDCRIVPKDQYNYYYDYVDSGNYVYFRYASCWDDKRSPFKKFEQQLIDCIEQKKPKKLIIDLRGNGGGNKDLLSHFMNYLRTSDINNKKKHSIYVLTDRRTYSAAIIAAVTIKKSTYATVVGEAPGCNSAFYGGVKYFELPASKMRAGYSSSYWAYDVSTTGVLEPDIAIPLSLGDYINCYDRVLNYVVGLKN